MPVTNGKSVVIFGGAGNIGSHIAEAFLDSGTDKVVIVSRRKDAIKEVTARINNNTNNNGRVVGVTGDINDANAMESLKSQILEAAGGKIDHIIVSVGFGWYQGNSLQQTSNKELTQVIGDLVQAPLTIWRDYYSLVQGNDQGSFIFINGGAEGMYLGPGTGLMTVGGAGLRAVANVAQIESAKDNACVASISLNLAVVPEPDKMPKSGGFKCISSKSVGEAVASMCDKRKSKSRSNLIRNWDDINRLKLNGVL